MMHGTMNVKLISYLRISSCLLSRR